MVHRTDPLIGHAFTSDRQKGNRFDHPGLFMVKPMGVSRCGHTEATREAEEGRSSEDKTRIHDLGEACLVPLGRTEIGSRVLRGRGGNLS